METFIRPVFITYSGWQMDATRVQSSRFQRVWGGSLKAELSTGRTHLPTAITHYIMRRPQVLPHPIHIAASY